MGKLTDRPLCFHRLVGCRAFVFVIRFKFTSVDDRDAWFKKFKILAEYVAENEPTTLAYEAAVAEDDPLEVLCYERYALL